ncbi:hypothetical protein TDB9533_02079 [Thalassocella blandensis]|nr:hypothetical protein TDB9533_02079 [Thalassocella blandensis]
MSVISVSLFSLKRARKAMENAYHQGDWEEVRRWDTEIAQHLNDAFEDGARDTKALIRELQTILQTYAKIVEALPDSCGQFMVGPEFRF